MAHAFDAPQVPFSSTHGIQLVDPLCAQAMIDAVERVREQVLVLRDRGSGALFLAFPARGAAERRAYNEEELVGMLPAIYPEWLGDRTFTEAHGARFPYVVGEMARGIATPSMVVAGVRAGLVAFYGSAGLSPQRIQEGLQEIGDALRRDEVSWGANLIHTPDEPQLEERIVDLFLAGGVQRASASAFMSLTPAVVRYACSGLHRARDGRIARTNHLFAKISRPEIAQLFLSPAPEPMLSALLSRGQLSATEAELARRVPLASDLTVEADSGGHTDNRPLIGLLPAILALRDRLCSEHRYECSTRVGAAGGLGTPGAVAAAFALGAAYVLTGSINQSARESGLSAVGRRMLAHAGIADVAMAPAADMFEIGVNVQVLKRGTMFAPRAQKLYALFRSYPSLDDLPAPERETLERDYFRSSLAEVWDKTRHFFLKRDRCQVERAESDPRHLMALVFRWYLAHGSRWAAEGVEDRRADYQIWCGPAMGAFNEWVRGSFLESLEERTVAQIARNLLEGAAAITRAQQLRSCGVALPAAAFSFPPRPLR